MIMGFKLGCACHTWAIDGYTNDDRAKNVSDKYDTLANEVMKLQTVDLNGKVDGLVATVRRLTNAAQAAENITVYGGFEHNTDGAPEHMWMEYKGWIYDTMPGAPLRRSGASPQTRLQPPSEGRAFAPNMVGKCTAKLTISQLQIITAAQGHWANNEFDPG
jgi:hypothetical protein